MRKLIKMLFVTLILCLAITVTASAASNCQHNWKEVKSTGEECSTRYVTYQCLKCNDYKNATLEPTKEHQWYEAYRGNPTCTKGGGINYVCLV